MAKRDSKRTEYINKLKHLELNIGSLKRDLRKVEAGINDLDKKLSGMPGRILRIRKMNFKVLAYLEGDHTSLYERWKELRPELRDRVNRRTEDLLWDLKDIERKLSQRRREAVFDVVRLIGIESRLISLSSKLSRLKGDVSDNLREFRSNLESLERDLKIAESTVNITLDASFQWKKEESPIYAAKAKDLENEMEGIVTLTNRRFLFESEKNVVLKKMLFIATEKKKVRKLVVDQPIGIIDNIQKGRVGFWAGHGVFINFKSGSTLREMKIDVKGYEADQILRFYHFIVSGEAERELSSIKEVEGFKEENELGTLVCEICGAPHTDEIYMGQTSIKCKYCGSMIIIPL